MESGLLAIRPSKAFPLSAPSDSLAPLLALVDSASVAHILAFRRPEDAQRCLLGRLLPRFAVATLFNLPWRSTSFRRTELGRPYAVHDQLPATFDFNVSHDSDWVVLFWSRLAKRVGVDVMRVRIPWDGETVDQFVEGLQDQLTGPEKEWLRASGTAHDKLRRAFALWTLKEAYAKARGEGVRFDFQRLNLQFEGSGGAGWLTGEVGAFVDGAPLVGWTFRLLELPESYFVAIAVEGQWERRELDLGTLLRELGLEEIVGVATRPEGINSMPDQRAERKLCTPGQA